MSGRNAGRATPPVARTPRRAKPRRSAWDHLSYELLNASLEARTYADLSDWDEATAAAHRAGTVAAMLAAALDEDVRTTGPLLAAALDEDGYGS